MDDKDRFLKFAFKFIEEMGSKFLDPGAISKENGLRCKEVVFPAGFSIDKNGKIYTPVVSKLYGLATTDQTNVVRVMGL